MTYRFRDIVGILCAGVLIGCVIGSVIPDAKGTANNVPRGEFDQVVASLQSDLKRHEGFINESRRYCDAPCTVVLPPKTLEDEWGVNYGWERLRDADGHVRNYPILDVYPKRAG